MTAPLIQIPTIDIDRIRHGDLLATAEAFEAYGSVLSQLAQAASTRTGRWRDAQLVGANFRDATGSGGWTVDTGDILRARYCLIDDLLLFSIHLSGTAINNPTTGFLEIDLPAGLIIAGDPGSEQFGTFVWLSATTPPEWETGMVIAGAGGRSVFLFRADGPLPALGGFKPFPVNVMDLGFVMIVEAARG